jgi:hypothetical protein
MNGQAKNIQMIMGIKKELMDKERWHDYLVKQLNQVNKEIPLLEDELTKELDRINTDDDVFDSAQSASDMLGLP